MIKMDRKKREKINECNSSLRRESGFSGAAE
jgi:hypothetical protein